MYFGSFGELFMVQFAVGVSSDEASYFSVRRKKLKRMFSVLLSLHRGAAVGPYSFKICPAVACLVTAWVFVLKLQDLIRPLAFVVYG